MRRGGARRLCDTISCIDYAGKERNLHNICRNIFRTQIAHSARGSPAWPAEAAPCPAPAASACSWQATSYYNSNLCSLQTLFTRTFLSTPYDWVRDRRQVGWGLLGLGGNLFLPFPIKIGVLQDEGSGNEAKRNKQNKFTK